jgi:hypothetical protein
MKAETYWPQGETDNLLRADRILCRKVYRKGTPDSTNHGKLDRSNYSTIYRMAAYHAVTFRRFSFFWTTMDKLINKNKLK